MKKNNIIRIALITLFTFTFISCQQQSKSTESYSTVSVADFKHAIDQQQGIILDVRTLKNLQKDICREQWTLTSTVPTLKNKLKNWTNQKTMKCTVVPVKEARKHLRWWRTRICTCNKSGWWNTQLAGERISGREMNLLIKHKWTFAWHIAWFCRWLSVLELCRMREWYLHDNFCMV